MIKLCLLGCGGLSKHYIKAIERLPFKITTTVDPNLLNIPKLNNLNSIEHKHFNCFNDAIKYNKNNFDAVCILTPHDSHYDLTMKSIKINKHVLLEKPIAITLNDAREILNKSKNNKKVFMVGENAVYWPEIVKTKELINKNEIGKIITTHSHYYESMKHAPFDKKDLGWRGKISNCGGGVVIDGGSHWIRPLKIWMGDIKSVVATCHSPTQEIEGESHVDAMFKFVNGKTATFKSTVLMNTETSNDDAGWFKIIGTKGEIIIKNDFNGGMKLYNDKYPNGYNLFENISENEYGFLSSYYFELKDFYYAIKYKKKLTSTPEDAYNDLKIIKSIYKSNDTGKWIDI